MMLAIIYGILLAISPSAPLPDESRLLVADTIKNPSRNGKAHLTDSVGKFLEVNRIVITGNKLTRATIILRELSLKKGDIINENFLPKIIEKDERKLFNLHLFNTTTITPLNVGNGMLDLLVEVEERWYTFPVPIFQLSDRNFNEWWENYNHDFSRVNYGIKLYQYNILGRNQTMTLMAQFGFQKRFQFMYKIPYINKSQKQGLILEMDFIEAKSVADSTIEHKLRYFKYDHVLRNTKGIGISYTYRNNFYISHKLKYEYRETNIADTLQALNENYLGPEKTRQQYDAITYEFVTDHRDVIAYPLKGYQFYFHFQQYGIALNKDFHKTEVFASFAGHADLKKNYNLSNQTFVYASTPNNIPYFNYGGLGYNRTFVRGYEIYVIEGPSFFLNKTTFKKRIFSQTWKVENSPIKQFNHFPLAIYLKAYGDFGYVENYPTYTKNSFNTLLSDKVIGGGGFGLDFVSAYDMVVRFEYTFTSQNNGGFFFHIKKEF
jgi:outer membrane protein assembly factor BamA